MPLEDDVVVALLQQVLLRHEFQPVLAPLDAATPTTGGPRPAKTGPVGGANSTALQQENNTLKETVQGLEVERDFYFSKLRDIELLIQQAVEEDPEIEKQEDGLIKQIQTILYSTEEGFEIPAEGDAVDDQETF